MDRRLLLPLAVFLAALLFAILIAVVVISRDTAGSRAPDYPLTLTL